MSGKDGAIGGVTPNFLASSSELSTFYLPHAEAVGDYRKHIRRSLLGRIADYMAKNAEEGGDFLDCFDEEHEDSRIIVTARAVVLTTRQFNHLRAYISDLEATIRRNNGTGEDS